MDSIIWRDQSLILKDGVKLQSRIWMPSKGGPWPALLMRQPYGREIASTITYNHPIWWASHGYLVVVQDVRGQGDSDGIFTGFKQEASDTTETHQWVRSLPECNGLLGTYGFSYQGLTQLIAEPNTPPPQCLAPAMTGLDENSHWSCDGGAFWWHIGLSWGLQLAALQARRNGCVETWERIRLSLESGSYLREGPSLLEEHDPKGMVHEWLLRSNKDKQEWEIHKPLSQWLCQPMFLIGGWWDPHLRGVLDLYQKSIAAGGSPEIHIGPASHLHWWEEAQNDLLNFFNQHLQSVRPLKESCKKQKLWNITRKNWQLSTRASHPFSEWGLITSNVGASLNCSEGVLKPNVPGSGYINIVHDPWRPVPAIGGHLSTKPGNADRRKIDIRSDVAIFTSPKLEESLHLEGIPKLNLIAESDKYGFDLCVALSIVKHDINQVIQISTGTLRILGDQARKPYQRQITFQAILVDLEKGERLRLSIAGSSWPAIGVNPGKKDQPCGAPGPHCNVITIGLKLNNSNFQVLPLLS